MLLMTFEAEAKGNHGLTDGFSCYVSRSSTANEALGSTMCKNAELGNASFFFNVTYAQQISSISCVLPS